MSEKRKTLKGLAVFETTPYGSAKPILSSRQNYPSGPGPLKIKHLEAKNSGCFYFIGDFQVRLKQTLIKGVIGKNPLKVVLKEPGWHHFSGSIPKTRI
jgi:hypothetical protein